MPTMTNGTARVAPQGHHDVYPMSWGLASLAEVRLIGTVPCLLKAAISL
jgi:hypothetical protein